MRGFMLSSGSSRPSNHVETPGFATLPVISLPAGFNSDGLPMGIQVLARSHADLDLLQLAHGFGSVDTSSGGGLTRM